MQVSGLILRGGGAAITRGPGIAFDLGGSYSTGGRNRFAGVGVYVCKAGGREAWATRGLKTFSRRTHEDSFCSIVRRAHVRERLRVCLPLPRGHEEDRRSAGEESETVGAADGRCQEIPRRR